MFPPKNQKPSLPPHAESDCGMDEEASLKNEILAELIEALQGGLSKDIDSKVKKPEPEALEIDVLAAEPKDEGHKLDLNLDEDDEDYR